MTFQQLTYVVEIAKCGSINKAAHKLYLSQSGISTAVRDLEEELGIRFFFRSNRGVEFTPEGKEFLGHAVSLLEQKQRIESLYGESQKAAAPTRFSLSTQRFPFSEAAFLRLLETTEEHRYRFSIKETELDAVVDDVYDHRADVGVISLSDLTEKIVLSLLKTRDMEFHELGSVQPCIYVRRDHPLAALEQVEEGDLSGYPYVSFELQQGVASDFFEEYPIVTLKKADRSVSVNNRYTAINVLAGTDAFTTGSGLLSEGLSDPAVVTVPLAGSASIRVGWFHPRYSRLTPLTEQFVALLKEAFHDSLRYTKACHQARARTAEVL